MSGRHDAHEGRPEDGHDGGPEGEHDGELAAGCLVSALTVTVELTAVPADHVVAGSPSTGSRGLDESRGIGVWEMTPGTMSDVEVAEVFVVIAGSATLTFVEPAHAPIELAPGAVVRLDAGMQTVWTVRKTLRKVYLI